MVAAPSSAVTTLGALRRVTFTHDFLRPQHVRDYPTPVPRNLAWLVQLLGGAGRWKERGAEVSIVNVPPLADKAFGTLVNNEAALEEYKSDPDGAWARRYDVASLDVFAPLLSRLLGGDLVIGFELSSSIKRYLHGNRVPYFNVYIHPLRFLADMCLAVTTNPSQIAKSLVRHTIGASLISQELRRDAARFANDHSAAYSIPPSTPILIGQTERDSAFYQRHQLCSLNVAGLIGQNRLDSPPGPTQHPQIPRTKRISYPQPLLFGRLHVFRLRCVAGPRDGVTLLAS